MSWIDGYGPRSLHMGKVETDLDKIEEMVERFERQVLLGFLTDDSPLDENVEAALQEVLMIVKLLHGEELGKHISDHRKDLLEKREHQLEQERQRKLKIKLDRVKDQNKNKTLAKIIRTALGLDDDNDKKPRGGSGIAPF